MRAQIPEHPRARGDDSAAVRKILQRVLKQAKVPIGKVFEAADGMEALETLRTESVNLILSDITMPEMDGITLCGSRRPKTLLRVARFICPTKSARGK